MYAIQVTLILSSVSVVALLLWVSGFNYGRYVGSQDAIDHYKELHKSQKAHNDWPKGNNPDYDNFKPILHDMDPHRRDQS